MNDNQEKHNSFEDGDEKVPFTKRLAKFSAFIYLGLAITVVLVATVGIFSMSYDYQSELDSVSIPDVDFDTQLSVPPIIITPEDVSDDDKPVNNQPEGVTDEITKPDVSVPDISLPEEIPSEPEPEASQPPQTPVFYNPVEGEIYKAYSMDALVYSETMEDYRVHSGTDIAAEKGTPVLCCLDGIVESINQDYFYGMTVAVNHGNGMVTYYMNLDPFLEENVIVGKEIKGGQAIGVVGDSARCENNEPSHLHFEIRMDDELMDPSEILQ